MHEQIDAALLKQWLGRQEVLRDEVTVFPFRALAAAIEAPYASPGQTGDPLPPLWHWPYFLPLPARSNPGPSFMTVRNEIGAGADPGQTPRPWEEHDIVYRAAGRPERLGERHRDPGVPPACRHPEGDLPSAGSTRFCRNR